jgi:asparagine N-glycosylation enzyme membrane subunit Stt3
VGIVNEPRTPYPLLDAPNTPVEVIAVAAAFGAGCVIAACTLAALVVVLAASGLASLLVLGTTIVVIRVANRVARDPVAAGLLACTAVLVLMLAWGPRA